MSRCIEIPAQIFVTSVTNHKDIKQAVLNSIAAMGTFSYVVGTNQLSSTDWHLANNIPRTYYPLVQPPISEHISSFVEEYGYTEASAGRVWYQKYERGDFHDWHVHEQSMFFSVYYVSLPEGAASTQFTYKGVPFNVDVKEGDILTAPSYLVHRSAASASADPKVVVAFNMDAVFDPRNKNGAFNENRAKS
jgi:uncharacterized protein YjlB